MQLYDWVLSQFNEIQKVTDFIKSFSLFQLLASALISLISIFMTFQIKKDVPADLRLDLRRISTLILLSFGCYILFVLMQIGNISYPVVPVTASIFLGSACLVYAVLMLARRFTGRLKEKDIIVNSNMEDLMDQRELLTREMDERKRVQRALLIFEKALNTTKTGVTVAECNGTIIYTNPADAEMHGYSIEEMVGRNVSLFSSPDRCMPMNRDQIRNATTWVRESVNSRKDGSTFPVRLMSDVVKSEDGEIIGIVTNCEDITERKLAEEELFKYQTHLKKIVNERTRELSETVNCLEHEIKIRKDKEKQIEHMAYYDDLTGLPNRAYMNDQLHYALSNADNDVNILAVMYLDLDNFKRINDTLGHSMGDMLLLQVGERLAGSLRNYDSVISPHSSDTNPLISRLGGDEFVVLLPNLEKADDVHGVAQRIIDTLAAPFELDCQEVFVTTSIGVTLYPYHGLNAEKLLMNADAAMYHAKERGKNGYEIYSDSTNENARKMLALENDLHKVLKQDELYLVYQPQYDIKTGEVTGLEALLRWSHPNYGNIEPSVFIPMAEQHGLIIPIGDWVINEAVKQMTLWLEKGCAPLHVAINLSLYQFNQHDIVKSISKVLDKFQLDPKYLEVEITESLLMKNSADIINDLTRLKDIGVRISIDDFGTGYSSLRYLTKLPLDIIKVDKEFVKGIDTNPNAESVIKAIIAMGHSIDLLIVAEGVETDKQAEFLYNHDCDIVQGFLYSEPLLAEQVSGLLFKYRKICA